MRAWLLYWVDRLLDRQCWRNVCRSGYVSEWGWRSVAVECAESFTRGGDPTRIEYAHRPFFKHRVKVEERVVSQAHTPEASERRGNLIASTLSAMDAMRRLNDAIAPPLPKPRKASRRDRDEDRRAIEFLIASTKEPPK